MSQPDTLLDDLDKGAREIRECPLCESYEATFKQSAAEIRRLRAEVATLRTIGFNDLARLDAEVATLQAAATTYWNCLDDLIHLAEEAIEARKASDDEEDREMLDVFEERLNRGRSALGMKPTT